MERTDVTIQQERYLHQSFLSVKEYKLQHKLFAGGWSPIITRELVERPNSAAVLPYDPVLDKVVVIEQFRVGALAENTSPWLIEIVAGLIAEGETALELVHREAQEEAGLEILDTIHIYNYLASPGYTNESIALFCAKVDARNAQGIYGLTEEHEDIRVSCVSSAQAFEMVRKGEIKNGICLIALMWLELNLNKVRQDWLPATNPS